MSSGAAGGINFQSPPDTGLVKINTASRPAITFAGCRSTAAHELAGAAVAVRRLDSHFVLGRAADQQPLADAAWERRLTPHGRLERLERIERIERIERLVRLARMNRRDVPPPIGGGGRLAVRPSTKCESSGRTAPVGDVLAGCRYDLQIGESESGRVPDSIFTKPISGGD